MNKIYPAQLYNNSIARTKKYTQEPKNFSKGGVALMGRQTEQEETQSSDNDLSIADKVRQVFSKQRLLLKSQSDV